MPALERPDAEAAGARAACRIVDWADGTDPYAAVAARCCGPTGRYGISDSALGDAPARAAAGAARIDVPSLTECLPMLRAVKDPDELARLAAAGAAADATYERDRAGAASPAGGRPRSPPTSPPCCGSFGHEQVDFTVVGSGPNGANPHHEAGDRVIEAGDAVVLDFGGLMYGYGSDTTRTVCVGRADRRRSARCTRSSGRRSRPVSRRSGRASPARRSTGRPGRSSRTRGTASSSSTAPATASA